MVQLASEDNAVPKFDVAGLIFTAQYGLDRALAWRGHIQFRTKLPQTGFADERLPTPAQNLAQTANTLSVAHPRLIFIGFSS